MYLRLTTYKLRSSEVRSNYTEGRDDACSIHLPFWTRRSEYRDYNINIWSFGLKLQLTNIRMDILANFLLTIITIAQNILRRDEQSPEQEIQLTAVLSRPFLSNGK